MVTPPSELSTLGLDREHFVRADNKSWRGPCPRCGGTRRLLIFTDHPFPKWNCICDGCGLHAWADQLNSAVKAETTPQQRAEWSARNQADRLSREKARAEKLAEFSTHELWQELCNRMTAEHHAQWERWGVPLDWQSHLSLGYMADRAYWGADDELHHSPAFTIPYFHTGYTFQTMQYRLFNPPTPTDRYRFEQGLGTTYYQTEPAKLVEGRVIICEGAKKGMVVHIRGGQDGCSVLAIPSKSDFAGVVTAVKDADRVYVMLDPDAAYQARKLAAAIGSRARVVELPVKADDGILQYELTARDLAAYLRQAN